MAFGFRSERARDDAVRREQDARVEDAVPVGMKIAGSWSWRILLVAGVLALLIFVVIQLRVIVVPLMVAMLVAALLVPFSNWLQSRHRWPKWAAVAVSEVGVLALVGGLVWVTVRTVMSGYPALAEKTVSRWNEFTGWLADSPLHLSVDDIQAWVDGFIADLQKDSALWTGALSVGSSVGHFLAGFLLVLFTTLFILLDGRGIWHWVIKLFPRNARPAILGAGEAGWITLSTFMRVQVLVAFIDAVGIGLGAFILGLFYDGFPLVIPITIMVFLGAFVPIVGAVASGALAVFVALVFMGPFPALIMLVIVIGVQQLEGHVLQPFLVGNAVKIHPLAIVLAVAAGGFLAGIPGTLFAVPLVATVNAMIVFISRGDWRTNPHPSVADVVPPTRGRIPRAR